VCARSRSIKQKDTSKRCFERKLIGGVIFFWLCVAKEWETLKHIHSFDIDMHKLLSQYVRFYLDIVITEAKLSGVCCMHVCDGKFMLVPFGACSHRATHHMLLLFKAFRKHCWRENDITM